MAGFKTHFVDCKDDLTIDPNLIGKAISDCSYTVGDDRYATTVMPVHIYGRRCDTDSIVRAGNYRLNVIEDLAEAHGLKPHPSSLAACWSMYRNKTIHGEEGGVVWFREPEHAQLARQLRSLGFTENHDFIHVPRGHNYRMSNCHAELILKSLREADYNIQGRQVSVEMYDGVIPNQWKMPPRDFPWVYDLRIPGLTHERQLAIVQELNSQGIAARCGFKPMAMQPEFQGCYLATNAYRLSQEVFYLPLSPWMDWKTIRTAVEMLHRAVARLVPVPT